MKPTDARYGLYPRHSQNRPPSSLRNGQTLLFFRNDAAPIAELAAQMLRNPAKVPSRRPLDGRPRRAAYLHVDRARSQRSSPKFCGGESIDRALIFTRTKHGADKVCAPHAAGISAHAIHGNSRRTSAKTSACRISQGEVLTLVATDIARAGIDVARHQPRGEFRPAERAGNLLHRIGRTARAGAAGRRDLALRRRRGGLPRDIEKLFRMSIPATGPPEVSATDSAIDDPEPHARPSAHAPATATAEPRRRAAPARSTRAAAQAASVNCRRRIPAS